MKGSIRKVVLTLAIGFSGALGATYAGLPAASLIGASLAVSVASLLRLTTDIPVVLRNLSFSVIGCSLGSGFTREAISHSAQWPASLVILCVAVVVIMLVCNQLLTRFFAHSAETALLATSPGALSYSLALAASGIGDSRAIIVIQSVRLLLLTTMLPFILDHLGLQGGTADSGGHPAMSGAGFVVVYLATLIFGLLINRFRVPAAFLIAGMLISGIGHFTGAVSGRPAAEVLFVGFAVTGSMVGARFSTIPLADLKRLFSASLSVVLVSGALAACFALMTAALMHLPFGQVFVAYAPGGVEAMAAMAIALGYDPAYVATHHLFRIVLLIVALPFLIRLVPGRKNRKNAEI